jgi:hypothetical protein
MAADAASKSTELETVDLDLHPNEASDLLPVEASGILEGHGWDMAFWTVLDEGYVERCMAVIGHRRGESHGAESWQIVKPSFRVGASAKKTEDGEACARHDGWVYVVGSHYGSKAGPLEKKRAFIARFREDALEDDLEGENAEMEVAMNRFRLHRAVNDALRAFGPELIDVGARARKQFIKRTQKKAGKKAGQRIADRDVPINVEGASFSDAGLMLLGLRFPVTADGHPIIAEVAGVDAMFDDERAAPVVRRFWVIESVGTRERPGGIRAMHARGRDLHLIVGDLESEKEDAVVTQDHPEAALATSSHHRVRLPSGRDGGAVRGSAVHDFGFSNVEGLAADSGGRFFYATDEDDRVHMRYMREKAPSSSSSGKRAASGGGKQAGAGGRGGSAAKRGAGSADGRTAAAGKRTGGATGGRGGAGKRTEAGAGGRGGSAAKRGAGSAGGRGGTGPKSGAGSGRGAAAAKRGGRSTRAAAAS